MHGHLSKGLEIFLSLALISDKLKKKKFSVSDSINQRAKLVLIPALREESSPVQKMSLANATMQGSTMFCIDYMKGKYNLGQTISLVG